MHFAPHGTSATVLGQIRRVTLSAEDALARTAGFGPILNFAIKSVAVYR